MMIGKLPVNLTCSLIYYEKKLLVDFRDFLEGCGVTVKCCSY